MEDLEGAKLAEANKVAEGKKKKAEEAPSPKKKEIKVKSKEGLKSFLHTTERILEKLHLLRTRAALEKARLRAANEAGGEARSCSFDGADGETSSAEAAAHAAALEDMASKLQQILDVLGRGEISGIVRKLQIKALDWVPVALASGSPGGGSAGGAGEGAGELYRATKLQIILKWGGALTPLGEAQAQYLGETLRKKLYPDPSGGGVLRLHATFRHDLKIRTSDEGRVMKTAASFTKGMLQLEGSLTPILVSLVRKEKGSLHMLDHAGNEAVQPDLDACKSHLNTLLQVDGELSSEVIRQELAPELGPGSSVVRALNRMEKNPRTKLVAIRAAIEALVLDLERVVREIQGSGEFNATSAPVPVPELYMDETLLLLVDRWRKLRDAFYKPAKPKKDKATAEGKAGKDKDKKDKGKDKKKDKAGGTSGGVYAGASGQFDLTKVPDILDSIRYDLEHNQRRLPVRRELMPTLFQLAKDFADSYVPQEYGIRQDEKVVIGAKMCSELMKKIRNDLILGTEGNSADNSSNADMQFVDTPLFFPHAPFIARPHSPY